MNERIQELWDKAEHSVNEVFVWDPTGPDREDVIREKFAELMHDECIDAVPNDLDPATYFKVLQAIKNHFGF